MSSIAAMLLFYLDEEDAFWLFAKLMEGKDYLMAEMFINGLPGVHKATYVFEQLLSKKMKKFIKSFNESETLRLDSFCVRWYMLNMFNQLPFDIASLIWDIFISEGNKVIHNSTLALMRMFKSELNNQKPEEALFILLKVKDLDFDLERFFKKVLKSKVKEKDIRKFEAQWEKKKSITN
jgi:hypothetical protein